MEVFGAEAATTARTMGWGGKGLHRRHRLHRGHRGMVYIMCIEWHCGIEVGVLKGLECLNCIDRIKAWSALCIERGCIDCMKEE